MKALEAADAARRREAQRTAERVQQRQQLEAQKAERAKRAHDAKACPWDQPSTCIPEHHSGLAVVHLLTCHACLRLSGPCKPMAHLRLVGEVQSRQHCHSNEGDTLTKVQLAGRPGAEGGGGAAPGAGGDGEEGQGGKCQKASSTSTCKPFVEGACLCASQLDT